TAVSTSFSSMMNSLSWLVPGPSLSWSDWLPAPELRGRGCVLVAHPAFSAFPHQNCSTSHLQLRQSRGRGKTRGLRGGFSNQMRQLGDGPWPKFFLPRLKLRLLSIERSCPVSSGSLEIRTAGSSN